MYKVVSYPITDSVPAWPGSPQMRIEKVKQIAKGDAANTCVISIYGHIGTHYDAPRHFVPEGIPIAELPLDRFIFERPVVVDIPKEKLEKVTAADLTPFADRIAAGDLLMIRTGFSRYRKEDPKCYEEEGPAISAECAEYLVSHFPKLSAVAVDFVSIASYGDRKDGDRTHQILLGGKGGHFICAIEDVNMAEVNEAKLKRVFALPLMVHGTDSGPVTIIAEEL